MARRGKGRNLGFIICQTLGDERRNLGGFIENFCSAMGEIVPRLCQRHRPLIFSNSQPAGLLACPADSLLAGLFSGLLSSLAGCLAFGLVGGLPWLAGSLPPWGGLPLPPLGMKSSYKSNGPLYKFALNFAQGRPGEVFPCLPLERSCLYNSLFPLQNSLLILLSGRPGEVSLSPMEQNYPINAMNPLVNCLMKFTQLAFWRGPPPASPWIEIFLWD